MDTETYRERRRRIVGMTSRLGQRLVTHARKPWWPLVTNVVATGVIGDRFAALRQEQERLDDLQPTHNIYGTERRSHSRRAELAPID